MPKKIENPTPKQLKHREYNYKWWVANKDNELRKRREKNAKERAAKGLPPFTRKSKQALEDRKKSAKTATKKTTKKKSATKLTKAQQKANHRARNEKWRSRVKKRKEAEAEADRLKRIAEYNNTFNSGKSTGNR